MSDSIGPRSLVKKTAQYLDEAIDGAIQVETPGGVWQTMAFGALGNAAVQRGRAARDAMSREQPQGLTAKPNQVPRWAVLAVTPSALHLLATSQFGRIKPGAADIAVPLTDIASVVINKRGLTTTFEVQLRSGDALKGETKRIGMNRHNTDLLRMLQERVTTP